MERGLKRRALKMTGEGRTPRRYSAELYGRGIWRRGFEDEKSSRGGQARHLEKPETVASLEPQGIDEDRV